MTAARHDVAPDFDGFYGAHFRDTVSIVYGYTGDLGDAQDIAQEAFARAWLQWSKLVDYDNPILWVRRVATNLAHSRWRRVKVASAYLVRQRPDDIPELSPESIDIVSALKTLPPNQRKAIVLHYLVDMPVDEVAVELDVPVNTVKSWLLRGRNTLSAQLGDEVRRKVVPESAAKLRKKAEREQAIRRLATAVTVFLAVLGALLFIVTGTRLPSVPPATPSPSVSPEPPPKAFPDVCTPELLPLPEDGGVAGFVIAGDPSGQYLVGRAMGSDGLARSVIWQDGELAVSFMLSKETVTWTDVNSAGIAVGVTGSGADAKAWIRPDGYLKILNGVRASAAAINSAGVVAGSSGDRPVIWRTPESDPEMLPMLDGQTVGYASAISEDGVVVGVMGVASPEPRSPAKTQALVWLPGGVVQKLPPLPRMPDATTMIAYAIRGDWVSGFVADSTASAAVRWNLRTGAVEELPGNTVRINARGWTAGGGSDRIYGEGRSTAVGRDIDGVSYVVTDIKAISDDGRTLAGGLARDASGNDEPVRWLCR